ncbi:helix-turn-helix domain-containing protein [Streptomyces sp. NPDC057052]|uniref:helix-turn-helix domain-containing protein n=1 Tax=Streptomyces sp. NPDC057052 TaxID=3346010 RepID=UPI0036305EF5
MKWHLRKAAADREVWTATELGRRLAARGRPMSAGKLSGLWSGQPVSLKLADLDALCTVLDCDLADLLTPEHTHVVLATRVTARTGPAARHG